MVSSTPVAISIRSENNHFLQTAQAHLNPLSKSPPASAHLKCSQQRPGRALDRALISSLLEPPQTNLYDSFRIPCILCSRPRPMGISDHTPNCQSLNWLGTLVPRQSRRDTYPSRSFFEPVPGARSWQQLRSLRSSQPHPVASWIICSTGQTSI
jgi:hypothetical protein